MHSMKKVQHRSSTHRQRYQLKMFLIFNDLYQILCDSRQPLLRFGDQTSQQITSLPIFLSFLFMGLGVLQISLNTRHSSLFKNYPFLIHFSKKQIPQKFETFYLQLLEQSHRKSEKKLRGSKFENFQESRPSDDFIPSSESQCETSQISTDENALIPKANSKVSAQKQDRENLDQALEKIRMVLLSNEKSESHKIESVEFQKLSFEIQQFLQDSKKFLTIHPSLFQKVQFIHPNSLWVYTTPRWFQLFFHKTLGNLLLQETLLQVQKTQDQIPRKIQGFQTQKFNNLAFQKRPFLFPLKKSEYIEESQELFSKIERLKKFLTFVQSIQNKIPEFELFFFEKQKIQNHLQCPHSYLNIGLRWKKAKSSYPSDINFGWNWKKIAKTKIEQDCWVQKTQDSNFENLSFVTKIPHEEGLQFTYMVGDPLMNENLQILQTRRSNPDPKYYQYLKENLSKFLDQSSQIERSSNEVNSNLLRNIENDFKDSETRQSQNRSLKFSIQKDVPNQFWTNISPIEMLTSVSESIDHELSKFENQARSFDQQSELLASITRDKNRTDKLPGHLVTFNNLLNLYKYRQSIQRTINAQKFLQIQTLLNQKRKARAASMIFYEDLFDQRIEAFLNSFHHSKNLKEQRQLIIEVKSLIFDFSRILIHLPIDQWENSLNQTRTFLFEKLTELFLEKRMQNVSSSFLVIVDLIRDTYRDLITLLEDSDQETQTIKNQGQVLLTESKFSNDLEFTFKFQKVNPFDQPTIILPKNSIEEFQMEKRIDLKFWINQEKQRIQQTLRILKDFQWEHLTKSQISKFSFENNKPLQDARKGLDSSESEMINQTHLESEAASKIQKNFETLRWILKRNLHNHRGKITPLIESVLPPLSYPRQLSGYFFADLENARVPNFLKNSSQIIKISLPIGFEMWDSNFISIFAGSPSRQSWTLTDISTTKDPWLIHETQNQINLFKYQQHLLKRTQPFSQKNSQFFEIREKFSEYSWSILFFFSSGWFFVNIFRDLYKKYAKEMIESCIDFLKRAGILEKGDVQWIKEELGLTPIDKGYRGIRHQGKKLKNITGMDHLILQVNEMVWFLKTKKLIPRPFFIFRSVHFLRRMWISVQSVRQMLPNEIEDQQSPNSLKPKGFLFAGPPGTGKTLLVQAIAGETGVPVVTQSGGLLQNPRQRGRGAKTLHKLFLRAREIAPCIIFIDEVDGIGKRRQFQPLFYDIHGRYDPIQLLENDGHLSPPENLQNTKVHTRRRAQFFDDTDPYWKEPEFTQTIQWTRVPIEVLEDVESSRAERHEQVSILTQLLIELDGIRSLDNILVIGATNRLEILDPALMRPGRFQRILKLSLPDYEGRVNLLKFYTKKIESHLMGAISGLESVSWDYFAKRTHGFSSADIASIVFASELTAIQKGTSHTSETLERGLDLITSYTRDPLKDRFQNIAGVFQNFLDEFLIENSFYFFEKSKNTQLDDLIRGFSSIQKAKLAFLIGQSLPRKLGQSQQFPQISRLQCLSFYFSREWNRPLFLYRSRRSSRNSSIFSYPHIFKVKTTSTLFDF